MPRGVYDRTKTKAQREAEKAAKGAAPAAKTKGKPGRKPGSAKVTKSAAPAKTAEAKVSYGTDAIGLFATVRANLDTLNALSSRFPDVVSIRTEIEAHIEVMSNLRKQVFGSGETQAQTESTETVVETASASNGTTAAAPQYPSTVPMPPAPIPSIPTATH